MENIQTEYSIEFFEPAAFSKSLKSLSRSQTKAVLVALEEILAREGIHLQETLWLRSISQGLWEFRIGKTTSAIYSQSGQLKELNLAHEKLLFRVFCTFHRNKVIVLLSGYNKASDPSLKRQLREIKKAQKLFNEWHKTID